MQRKSFVTSAVLGAGLALGLVFGPAIADNASAQTPSPSVSARASASTSADAASTASTAVSPMDMLRSLFLDNVAEALGIDRTALDSAITTAASSTAADAVANGTLTQTQANALEVRIQSGEWGFGSGRGGPGGFPGGVRIPGVRDAIVAAAAQTLNLTENELHTQLHDGQTLAQLAQVQGTTEQAVIDAALAAAKTELDTAVANGTVTQAQADAAYAQLQERGADLLSGGRGRGGPGGHHGRDGEGMPTRPKASPSTSTTPDA